jgi:hypothetical protein
VTVWRSFNSEPTLEGDSMILDQYIRQFEELKGDLKAQRDTLNERLNHTIYKIDGNSEGIKMLEGTVDNIRSETLEIKSKEDLLLERQLAQTKNIEIEVTQYKNEILGKIEQVMTAGAQGKADIKHEVLETKSEVVERLTEQNVNGLQPILVSVNQILENEVERYRRLKKEMEPYWRYWKITKKMD